MHVQRAAEPPDASAGDIVKGAESVSVSECECLVLVSLSLSLSVLSFLADHIFGVGVVASDTEKSRGRRVKAGPKAERSLNSERASEQRTQAQKMSFTLGGRPQKLWTPEAGPMTCY